MQRANDNSNQTIQQMRQTVQTLALRVNQLERMLDGKELREAKVESGTVYQRGTRLSLSNGMIAPSWSATSVTGGTTIDVDTLVELSYFYEFGIYSITANVVRVNAGEIQDSLQNVVTADADNITIEPTGTTYIYVQYTYGGAAVIKGSTARPVMSELTYRRILHQWTLVGGVATLSKISHIGNIVIPGTFATEA